MTIDDAINELDTKYAPNWSITRDAYSVWIVRVHNATGSHSRDTIKSLSLTQALTQAAAHVVLPIIPRQPTLLSRDQFVIKRPDNDRYFRAYYHDRDTGLADTLKRNLEAHCDRAVERAALAREMWSQTHGHFVATHVGGVDFVHPEYVL